MYSEREGATPGGISSKGQDHTHTSSPLQCVRRRGEVEDSLSALSIISVYNAAHARHDAQSNYTERMRKSLRRRDARA